MHYNLSLPFTLVLKEYRFSINNSTRQITPLQPDHYIYKTYLELNYPAVPNQH